MIYVLSEADEIERRLDAVSTSRVRTVPICAGVGVDGDEVDVVIVDTGRDVDRAIGVAAEIDLRRPEVVVVLWADRSSDVVSRAMRAGVRDVLTPEDDDDHLRRVVEQAAEISRRRRSVIHLPEPPTARNIVVVSPKGGAGKTAMATNLATGLALRSPRDVVLADADLQFGDVGHALCLQPETTVRDAVAGRLDDPAAVKVHLTPHRSGLFVLAAPDHPGVADEISPQAYVRAVEMLAGSFGFVVVDTDPGLGERTLGLLEHATDVVLLASTDVASVRGMRKTVDALDAVGLTEATRHFVLNRADAQVGLDLADIAATIGAEPDVLVPSHRTVPMSMNDGVPLVEGELASPVTEAMWQLVDRFSPVAATQKPHDGRRGLLRWIAS